MIVLCKNIHRNFPADIGGRRDDRGRSSQPCNLLCVRICAADVAGQQRNHILPRLIEHEHRRILCLALQKRCDRPHCNAAGSDKYDQLCLGKAGRTPALQSLFIPENLILRCKSIRNPVCQPAALLCKICNSGFFHDLFYFRSSVA